MKVCIFTNSTRNAPNLYPLSETVESFKNTFGDATFIVYLDKNPCVDSYKDYKNNLKQKYVVRDTEGLADGFIKAITENDDDYLFMLEHDWSFQNINHSLDEILSLMKKNNIYYFGFNKNYNKLGKGIVSSFMKERSGTIKYVECDSLSNYPHIIDRKYYQDNIIQKIKLKGGSYGVEANLSNAELVGCRYGGLNYPPTLKHLNGKCLKEDS